MVSRSGPRSMDISTREGRDDGWPQAGREGRPGAPEAEGAALFSTMNREFAPKFTKYSFTWIRFFLQCCATVRTSTTFREALCTDMAEYFSPPRETGLPARQIHVAPRRARIALVPWSRRRSPTLNGLRSSIGSCSACLFLSRPSLLPAELSLAVDRSSRTFQSRNRSDRFRHARMMRSLSRLAVRRFALQRLSGGVLPPQ